MNIFNYKSKTLNTMKYCNKCGKMCNDSTMFCPYCGNSFNNGKNKPGDSKRFIPLIVIALIMAVGCVVYYVISNKRYETRKVLAITKYDEIGDFGEYGADGLALVRKNVDGQTFYGFINERYEEIVPCAYYSVEPFEDNVSIAVLLDKYIIIDTRGKIIKYLQGEELMSLFETIEHWAGTELDVVRRNGKYGVIEKRNKSIIVCKYDMIYINDGYLAIEFCGRWGAADRQGKMFIPVEYTMGISPLNHDDFAEFFVLADSNLNEGMMNKKGEVIIPFEYESVWGCLGRNDLIRVKKRGKYGVYDLGGNLLTSIKYDYPPQFNKYGLASVTCDGKYGLLDVNGNEIVPVIYDQEIKFRDNSKYAEIKSGGKYGLIDNKGKLIVPVAYDEIDGGYECQFYDGRMVVKKNGKYGYVDTSGKIVISCKYDSAENFYHGRAYVDYNGKNYEIDVKGNRVY